MVCSELTDNLTVAFILGAILCGIVVSFESFLFAFSSALGRAATGFGPIAAFQEMAATPIQNTG